jgi:aspartyl-tRNA(Asn)/glutamyl-tRNA(Gln) amidotransferase subunit A
MIIMLAEPYAIHETNLRARFTDFGEVFRSRMALGGLLTSADYIQAVRRRRELIDEFDLAMENFDIILTATTRSEAPQIDTVGKFSILERPLLTLPFNVTGSPAMSVCCGYSENGLPLSMQIVGKRFDDATVLRVADAYEQATPWRKRRPVLEDEQRIQAGCLND